MSAVATRLAGARRHAVAFAVVPLAALVALPFVGRWEERRNADLQNARMAAIYRLATSEGVISPRLYAYRLGWRFDCLVYASPTDPRATNALELCFDADGRLIETIDRRASTPHFASLREQPSLATIRVSPRQIIAAFAAAGGFRYDARLQGVSRDSTTLPVGYSDLGAWHFPRLRPRPHGH